MATNPYLFAVGCPRSGTTLLQRMLDTHPLLAVSNDPHFIPFAPGVAVGSDPPLTPELVDWVIGYRTFHRLGLDRETAIEAAREAQTYGQFVAALYDALAASRRKPLAGEKTPRYVRYLPLLHSLFPEARVVHLLRDGRDVALSMLDWARPDRGPGRFRLWEENPLAVAALFWRRHVLAGRREAQTLGELYSEVRYENLVLEPESTLKVLSARIGLPFAEEMLAFNRGRTRRQPGLSSKAAWLPPTPGLRDWRVSLSRRELELFDALAGDLLDALGYEWGTETISSEVESLATRYREAFAAELAKRRRATYEEAGAVLLRQS
jgi:Sulfotransferase family